MILPPLARSEVEIIEVGAVIGQLDDNCFKVLWQIQLYVKLVNHPNLTPFCRELTGIEQSQVSNAPMLSFAELEVKLRPGCMPRWGRFDAAQLEMESSLKHLPNPLAQLSHLKIKQFR